MRGPDERRTGAILREVEPEDLLKFGLIPEFIGRLPVVATLEDLDEPALVEILTKPKNALVKQYGRLFEMEGVKLSFTEDALHSVATRAIARKTGARGLRSIMEAILLGTMFDLPGLDGVEEVVINREVAEVAGQPAVPLRQGAGGDQRLTALRPTLRACRSATRLASPCRTSGPAADIGCKLRPAGGPSGRIIRRQTQTITGACRAAVGRIASPTVLKEVNDVAIGSAEPDKPRALPTSLSTRHRSAGTGREARQPVRARRRCCRCCRCATSSSSRT